MVPLNMCLGASVLVFERRHMLHCVVSPWLYIAMRMYIAVWLVILCIQPLACRMFIISMPLYYAYTKCQSLT